MDFKFVIFDTTQIENNDIIQSINNLYLSASLLLMKNIFRDMKELKPILKDIIQLDDDRVIRLFEYIVVNKDIKKEELKEIIDEVKGGDKIMTLAQRWLEEGKQEGIQIGVQQGIQQGIQTGIQTGIFETAIIMMEKLNHSIDEIVKVLNIKKEELIEYMDRKSKLK